jgi:hypothetical protein
MTQSAAPAKAATAKNLEARARIGGSPGFIKFDSEKC